MQKKPASQKQKIVELKQLVSQPQCLKLLILHTPFILNLEALPQCVNLVKLDLSKNNLTTFPYLGQLPNLKFMFIHENKLDIDSLIGIFQQNIGKQSRSLLSRAIIWVTFWGNKNQFSARHYLVNHTSVLAVDHHMVVSEQRNQSITVNKHFIQPFSQLTDITQLFQNRKKFNKNATQQQYMIQFWQDMSQIRKKNVQINPAIKIQKVFRGWILRIKQKRQKLIKQQGKVILQKFFKSWKSFARFQKKLTKILKKRNKQHLLLPLKQMRFEQARKKLSAFVAQCKKKLLLRKMNLKAQYVFFNALRSNQLALKNLYYALHAQKSNYLVIHIQGMDQFLKYVLPVAKLINQGTQIKIQANNNIQLRYLYEPARKRRQFLRLLELNQKSVAFIQPPKSQLQTKKQLNSNFPKNSIKLSRIYDSKNIHFSRQQLSSMKKIQKSFETKLTINLTQLKKVVPYAQNQSQKQRILRDIIRGIYFYNMGYLTNNVIPTQKINVLSQYSIQKMTAIIRIQRIWRGKILRRRIKQVIRQNFIYQRAATKIQRWYRSWKWNHRKMFMYNSIKMLRTFNCEIFYINMRDYVAMIKQNSLQYSYFDLGRVKFLQQYTLPYIHHQSKKILLSWNYESNNQSCLVNHRANKKLFTKYFLQKVFQNVDANFPSPIKYSQQKLYQKCQISHLFHYKTQVGLITKKNQLYLEVKCASKFDCRLRILGLILNNYQFNNKNTIQIFNKQSLLFSPIQQKNKRCIRNLNSVFLTQKQSSMQIQPMSSEVAKTFDYTSKFYINTENDKKPTKFTTNLKIILFDLESRQSNSATNQKSKQLKSITEGYNQRFDVSNFLIADTSQIRLDDIVRQNKLGDQLASIKGHVKRDSFKNVKLQKKLKLKNREKIHSEFIPQKDKSKFNFMLGDPHGYERLTTQPDLRTHQRSIGSILIQPQIRSNNQNENSIRKQNAGKLQSHHNYRQRNSLQSRIIIRKKANQQNKSGAKFLDQFTKNFINQGNFIQNQYLYGQIKRLKTEIQRNSVDQAMKIKTEQSQISKNVQRFHEQKVKKAQYSSQKHKQQIFRSMIEKRIDAQSKSKRKKIDLKELHYKSLPKKMRINFAEQCYPIIGKHPSNIGEQPK